MEASLIQRHFLATTQFTTEYNGVRVARKGLNKQFAYLVPFEEIPSSPFALRVYEKAAIMLTVVCSVVALIMLISMLTSPTNPLSIGGIITVVAFAGIPAAITWFTRKELTGFGVPVQGFIINANRPSREAVQSFLQSLHQAKLKYLREMYFDTPSNAAPADELKMLLWLKEQGAISADEFEARKPKGVQPTPSGSIGFAPKK
jgi:hypothetical protein